MRISFVILHYLVPEITQQCVNLLLCNDKQSGIVIVDNASPDGSGDLLKEKYKDEPRVHVLQLPVNEGFARGNNAGYAYALKHFDPDFTVVMNNDVFIDDAEFSAKLASEYEAEPFAVLGPDIRSTSAGVHQSPCSLSPMTLPQVRILRLKMLLKYLFLPLFPKTAKPKDAEGYDTPHSDCVLHGACYVFSKDFIKVRDNAFNPSTFLYCEEEILYAECKKAGLKMRYCPSVSVKHLEDAATRASSKSSFNCRRKKYKRLAASLHILESVLLRQRP